jgi:hypothetical protein
MKPLLGDNVINYGEVRGDVSRAAIDLYNKKPHEFQIESEGVYCDLYF